MTSIKVLRERAEKAAAELREAQKRVGMFGDEPGVGAMIQFDRTWPSGGKYTYGAIRVWQGWYTTGSMIDEGHSYGPHEWQELCGWMDVGTMRVATGFSTSTKDAYAYRQQVPMTLGFGGAGKARSMRSMLGHIGAPGTIFAVDPAKGGAVVAGRTYDMSGDTAFAMSPTALDEGSRRAAQENLHNPRGDAFYVAPHNEVRPSTSSPGEQVITLYAVYARGGGEPLRSFEGPDARWRANQSAFSRNRNAPSA